MTKTQITAIKCAYLDLMGALHARDRGNMESHDWNAHWETILELLEAFPELDLND